MFDHHSPSRQTPLSRPVTFWSSIIYLVSLIIFSVFIIACDEGNEPPSLLPLEERLWLVNTTNSLEIFARDPEGGSLQFNFSMEPLPSVLTEGALGQPTLTPLSINQALFQWAPSLRDVGVYSVSFTVTDEGGLSSTETIRLEVYSPGLGDQAALRFSDPVGAGQTLDLSRNPCLELEISVSAEGIPAEEILIDLNEPYVEGADFIPPGTFTGKQRRLSWCPSVTQLEERDRYTLNLRARRKRGEGWSEGITKRYLVRLQGSGEGPLDSCVGRPPTIQHDPPLALSGSLDYPIEIEVSDDLGIKSAPLLAVWSSEDPVIDELSDDRWTLSEFTRHPQIDGRWVAYIPNLNLAEGQYVDLFYALIVTDNDDPNGARCDHTTESQIYELTLLGGGEVTPQGLCAPCSDHRQCGGQSDLCLSYAEGNFCGRYCDPQAGCDLGYDCLELDTGGGGLVSQCVPQTLSCGPQCRPDEYDRTNEAELSVQEAPLLSAGSYRGLALCGESYDLYQIEVPDRSGLNVEVVFDANLIDIDLAVALGSSLDDRGELSFNYESALPNQSVEQISISCVQPNGGAERAWIAVYPYESNMRGEYQINLTLTPQSCDVQCIDDQYEGGEPTSLDEGIYSLALCPGDEDSFLIELSEGEVVSAYLDFILSQGDLDLSLYAENGQLIQRDVGARQGAWIEWRSDRSGRFLLTVTGSTPIVHNEYSLDLYFYSTIACESTADCPLSTFCYPQLGCLDETCSPELSCGDGHSCVYPLSSSVEGEGRCSSACYTNGMCRDFERCKLFTSGEGACITEGSVQVGGRCSRHEECAGSTSCVEVSGSFVCVEAGCEWVSCPNQMQCVEELGLSYCLPSCEQTCPPSWSCDERLGVRACWPS